MLVLACNVERCCIFIYRRYFYCLYVATIP